MNVTFSSFWFHMRYYYLSCDPKFQHVLFFFFFTCVLNTLPFTGLTETYSVFI